MTTMILYDEVRKPFISMRLNIKSFVSNYGAKNKLMLDAGLCLPHHCKKSGVAGRDSGLIRNSIFIQYPVTLCFKQRARFFQNKGKVV